MLKVPYVCPHPLCEIVQHYAPGRQIICDGPAGNRHSPMICKEARDDEDNIVGFCHRPEDHEQAMIAEWRKVVPDDATVIHLGDLAYKSNGRFKAITSKELTGARKLLIMGNHDRQRYSFYKQSGFQLARPFAIHYATPQEGRWKEAGYPSVHYVSFSHYPWNDEEEDGPMSPWDLRVHIHNNGYTRDGYVPFLRQHVNLSTEQTRYTPVNLKLLLDAVLLGKYPETTQAQLDDARERKEANKA
jgi:calcineurin-like phosphoesterase family protein